MTTDRRAQVMAALGNPNSPETSGDFSDLVSTSRRRYVDIKDHTRIVEGADDLVHPMAGRSGGGVARSTPEIPHMGGHAVKTDEDDTLAPRDLRTERQTEVMDSLIEQIQKLDAKLGEQAADYTRKKTEAGTWTPGRGGNASDWISRMIAKVRELRDAPKPATPDYEGQPSFNGAAVVQNRPANVQHDEMPVRKTKNGKPMPQYYAVEIDDVTKFYRIKAGTKPGWWWIEAQASDEFHPVKNVTTKNTILRAILDQGAEECMRNYGRKINNCGRCHRTLTDATSRANGIGPECEGKM
jgi:hypothetical protein